MQASATNKLRPKVIGVDICPQMGPDETPENLWLQVSIPQVQSTFKPAVPVLVLSP